MSDTLLQPLTILKPKVKNDLLRITEIFYSLQGETSSVGIPTVFIRLTGCPLRCGYCDSAYAFTGGELLSFTQIIEKVDNFTPQYITVTGGEPLAQPGCHILLKQLCDKGYRVSLETSGALDISAVDARVIKIMDIKTPGSGEVTRNLFTNFNFLTKQDEIKFVVCNRSDYDWAKTIIQQYNLLHYCTVLFSPSAEELSATELANWIVADRLQVRFQLQLHKILWGNTPGY